MKKNIIGIIICVLLIANVSAVLGITKDINISNKKIISYVILDNVECESHYVDFSRYGPNLAPNPSFEEGDILPANWTYYPNTNGIFNWDSNYTHSGNKSVGILNLTRSNSHKLSRGWTSTDFIPIDANGNTYLYSCWVKFNKEPPKECQYAVILINEYDENFSCHSAECILGVYTSNWSLLHYANLYTDPKIKYVKISLGQDYSIPPLNPDPTVEVRFDDVYFGVFNNSPPEAPSIKGPTRGFANTSYNYTITTTDPDGDDVYYRFICIPGKIDYNWYGPYTSGENIVINYIWNESRDYLIKVTAMDIYWGLGKTSMLEVTIPKNRAITYNSNWFSFLEQFPILQKLLNRLG